MCVWRAAFDNQSNPCVKGQAKDIHQMSGMAVEYILKNSLLRRSLDNVTVVIVSFSNFKHTIFGHQPLNQIKLGSEELLEKDSSNKK